MLHIHATSGDRPWARFPARLVAARVAAGLTQVGLAQLCARSGNSWVAMLEMGRERMPRQLDDVQMLAEAMGVPTEWLLFGHVFGRRGGPLAVGLGGDMVEAPADLAVYPGHWFNLSGQAGERTLLVDCRLPSPRSDDASFGTWSGAGAGTYLLETRKQLLATEGVPDTDGKLVANASPRVLDGRRLSGRIVGRVCDKR